MTGSAWIDAVLLALALVLLFGIASIAFVALWAAAHNRRNDRQPSAASRPDDSQPDSTTTDRAEVIAEAVDDLASCLVAERYGLDDAELDRLYARVYAGLSRLSHGQLVSALADALEPDADDRSRVLINQFRTLPTRTREN